MICAFAPLRTFFTLLKLSNPAPLHQLSLLRPKFNIFFVNHNSLVLFTYIN